MKPSIAIIICVVVAAMSATGQAQDTVDIGDLKQQLEEQAEQIRTLQDRLDQHESIFGVTPSSGGQSCIPESIVRAPLVMEEPVKPSCGDSGSEKAFHKLNYYADYDRGFLIRPFSPAKHPFQLKVNGWIQVRHHGFARDVNSWTDNAGVLRPIRNRNAFDIERGRLVFSGYAVDRRLTYFLQMDGDTDGAHTVDFFDYWWGWQLTEQFQIQMGKRKVPGSRQWLLGARRTRFIDRPVAVDFFRPDRTVGLFGVGTIGDSGHYEIMVGNGYRTANLPDASTDNKLTFAITNYFDPMGPFGGQLVDFDCTCDSLFRIGHSFIYSPQTTDTAGIPLSESDFLRLSDGTRIAQIGALAPGASVSDFDLILYGIDAAWKWQGWSINAEVFFRWINDLRADLPLPETNLYQHGHYIEGGRFLVPKKLDFNLRYSQVSGAFGNASEYAAGFNWYPLAKPTLKVSFDVTSLDGSPIQNTTSDILAGDDGTLFRTQFQAEF